MMVFPSLGGRFFDFEGFGMVEACRPYLDSGRLQIFAVDGRDACIVEEAVPFIQARSALSDAPRESRIGSMSGGRT